MPKPLVLDVTGTAAEELKLINERMKSIGESFVKMGGQATAVGVSMRDVSGSTTGVVAATGEAADSTAKLTAEIQRLTAFITSNKLVSDEQLAQFKALGAEEQKLETATNRLTTAELARAKAIQSGAQSAKEELATMTQAADVQGRITDSRLAAIIAAGELNKAEGARIDVLSAGQQISSAEVAVTNDQIEAYRRAVAAANERGTATGRVSDRLRNLNAEERQLLNIHSASVAEQQRLVALANKLGISVKDLAAADKELSREELALSKIRNVEINSRTISIDRLKLETQAYRVLRDQVQITDKAIQAMTDTELKDAMAKHTNAVAAERMGKTQGNVIKGFEGASQWMQRYHMDAAHYAAMLDRMTGAHTGLATVLRSGFIPGLIGVGLALSTVTFAIEAYQEHVKEMNKLTEESEKALIEQGKALSDNAGVYRILTAEQRESVRVGKELERIEIDKKIRELDKALEYHQSNWTAFWDSQKTVWPMYWEMLTDMGQAHLTFAESEKKFIEKSKEHERALEVIKKRVEELKYSLEHNGRTLDDRNKILELIATKTKDAADATSGLSSAAISFRDNQNLLRQAMVDGLITLDQYIAGMKALRELMAADEKKQHAKGENKHQQALDQFKKYQEDRARLNASAKEKLLLDEAEYNRKLDALARVLPEKYKEIQELKRQYHEEVVKKILQMDQEARDKIIKLYEELNNDIVASEKKRVDDLNKERERAYDRYIALVGTEEQRTHRRIAKEKAEWEDMYRKRLISETQLQKALEAMRKREHDATMKRIKQERDAKVKAAFAASKAIVSIGELTKNKQIQQLGQFIGVVEKIYNAWQTISSAIALFRRTTDAIAAVSAIKSGTTEKATQAGMASLEAQVNAFNSAAAIPMVGWMMAPGAMAMAAAATGWQSAAISALGSAGAAAVGAGQAHKGMAFDRDGSYLMNVQKGETIVPNTSGLMDLSSAITQIAETSSSHGSRQQPIVINFNGTVTDERRAGRTIAKMVSKAQGRYNVRG